MTRGEHRRGPKRAAGVGQVGAQLVEPAQAAGLAAVVLVARRRRRTPGGRAAPASAGDRPCRVQCSVRACEVERHLVGHVALDAAAARTRPAATIAGGRPPSHTSLGAGRERARHRRRPAGSSSSRSVFSCGTAGRGEAVELGPPVVVRRAPLGGQEAAVLEAVQRGIQRALFDEQRAAGHLLDPLHASA